MLLSDGLLILNTWICRDSICILYLGLHMCILIYLDYICSILTFAKLILFLMNIIDL